MMGSIDRRGARGRASPPTARSSIAGHDSHDFALVRLTRERHARPELRRHAGKVVTAVRRQQLGRGPGHGARERRQDRRRRLGLRGQRLAAATSRSCATRPTARSTPTFGGTGTVMTAVAAPQRARSGQRRAAADRRARPRRARARRRQRQRRLATATSRSPATGAKDRGRASKARAAPHPHFGGNVPFGVAVGEVGDVEVERARASASSLPTRLSWAASRSTCVTVPASYWVRTSSSVSFGQGARPLGGLHGRLLGREQAARVGEGVGDVSRSTPARASALAPASTPGGAANPRAAVEDDPVELHPDGPRVVVPVEVVVVEPARVPERRDRR